LEHLFANFVCTSASYLHRKMPVVFFLSLASLHPLLRSLSVNFRAKPVSESSLLSTSWRSSKAESVAVVSAHSFSEENFLFSLGENASRGWLGVWPAFLLGTKASSVARNSSTNEVGVLPNPHRNVNFLFSLFALLKRTFVLSTPRGSAVCVLALTENNLFFAVISLRRIGLFMQTTCMLYFWTSF
jgi:hypothetical protein